ncbi:MAG: pentapeptide repeat-containing protein [Thermodesulfobacteriota bacterium]|nr:pentapeptide repeat-containing protein [Thermodesulfobacteriota bacterium]
MSAKSQGKSDQSMKSIEVSSAKNNSLLLFFYIFSLYIFISVLNTTDLMLLLPTHTFKMPFIGFDLNLIFFYVLAPLLLLLLHFNILFNYYVHLKKLNAYKDQIKLENIDPSVYSYAYVLVNRGFTKGTVISVILWLLIYLLPLLVLVSIYQRFADYHHTFIAVLHLAIVFLDIILICCSIVSNRAYLKHSQNSTTLFSYLFIVLVLFIGLAEAAYFGAFYYPLTYDDYDSKLMEPYNKGEAGWFPSLVCKIHHPFLTYAKNASIECFPRLVVTEEEMAKISPAALYIPRYLAMEGTTEKTDKEKIDKEKKLILNYGTRINLANRNLRYSNLEKCILTRADMQESQLQAANLKSSHLQAADLSDTKLQDADLQEAKLQSATLIGTQLQGASFVGANMQKAQLWDSDLSNSNLQKVQLQQAKFVGGV